jgi:ribosome-associated protein
MIQISNGVAICDDEVTIRAVRAQGPGGQHINKVSTSIHLRFDINSSSLPDFYKSRLLQCNDHRITKNGVVVIKSQATRSQESNRLLAIEKLVVLIKSATKVVKKRRATKPTKGSKERRIKSKKVKSDRKTTRRKVDF